MLEPTRKWLLTSVPNYWKYSPCRNFPEDLRRLGWHRKHTKLIKIRVFAVKIGIYGLYILTNTPYVFHVETTWKRPFSCRFNMDTCDVFVEMEVHRQLVAYSYHHFLFEWSDGKLIDSMLKQKNKLGMRLSLYVKSRISVLPNFINFEKLTAQ